MRKSLDRTPTQPPPPRDFSSRFRNFILAELKRVFVTYDKDSNDLLDAEELKPLLTEVFGLNSEDVLTVSQKYFRADTKRRFQSFNVFVPNFLGYSSETGWTDLSNTLPRGRTNVTQEEFIRLVGDTFSKLNIQRVDRNLLIKFFEKIDTNSDGFVEYTDYKTWLSKFFSPQVFSGEDYYIQEDDEAVATGKHLIKEAVTGSGRKSHIDSRGSDHKIDLSPARSIESYERTVTTVQHQLKFETRTARQPSSSKISESGYSVRSGQSVKSTRSLVVKFTFNSQDLAKRVRKQMLYVLQKLDTNRNKQFEQSQIVKALQVLMKSDKNEVLYVIANVFRYDKNEDNIVTYQELANFFLEIHCGELAIQRLHKQGSYERGPQRMMNCKEFTMTVEYALSFIDIEPMEGELQALFKDIDQNRDGWITYQEYFQFLIFYFGTQSAVAKGELRSKRKTLYNSSFGNDIPPEERFAKLIRSQIRVQIISFDKNQNLKIQRDEAMAIATEVLNQTEEEATQMLNSIYVKNQTSFEYDNIVNKFLQIHSAETILVRLFKQGLLRNSEEKVLDLEDFIVLINSAFIYLPALPTKQHYLEIFGRISSTGNDLITFREYQHFVAKYLGKCDSRSFSTAFEGAPQKYKRQANSRNAKDKSLTTSLIAAFKESYDKVDISQEGITRDLYEQYIVSLFGRENRKDIDYLLWTAYRTDQDSDGRINFQQAVPLLFKVKAELGLNDLHRNNQDIYDKERINSDEFMALLQGSFGFFDFKNHLSGVFKRLDGDNDGFISDREYLSWILSISRGIEE